MKKIPLIPAIVLLTAVSIFISCKKSEEPASFTWTYGTQQYTANIKTASLYNMPGPTIMGGTGTNFLTPGVGPTVIVSSLAVGSYNFGAGSSNYVSYVDALGYVLNSGAGSLNISSNTGNRISGKFNGIISDTAHNPVALTISFNNLLIEN